MSICASKLYTYLGVDPAAVESGAGVLVGLVEPGTGADVLEPAFKSAVVEAGAGVLVGLVEPGTGADVLESAVVEAGAGVPVELGTGGDVLEPAVKSAVVEAGAGVPVELGTSGDVLEPAVVEAGASVLVELDTNSERTDTTQLRKSSTAHKWVARMLCIAHFVCPTYILRASCNPP